jgi:ribosomal protein L13E
MKLHDLVPNPGSKKERKRVGRGISAGQGKTAGLCIVKAAIYRSIAACRLCVVKALPRRIK